LNTSRQNKQDRDSQNSKAPRLVVLISGSGSNLQQFIDQTAAGKLNAEISAVISNRADAYGLQRAEKAGIETVVLDHTRFIDREAFDDSLAQVINSYQPDLIILAGFMRILSEPFVKQFAGKLLNIHPSLLPKYKGLHTHRRALEDGQKQHGASVHFVIPELDAGEVIMQGIVPVKETDTEETLADRVHQIEHIIYPEAVRLVLEGELETLEKPVKVYLQDA